MFESKDDAREFTFEIADAIAAELDRYLVRPTLDGASLYFDTGEGRARGTLDGRGYRVRKGSAADGEAGDWNTKLVVIKQ